MTASDHPALLDREEVDVGPILRIIFPKSILTLSPTLTHSGIFLQSLFRSLIPSLLTSPQRRTKVSGG